MDLVHLSSYVTLASSTQLGDTAKLVAEIAFKLRQRPSLDYLLQMGLAATGLSYATSLPVSILPPPSPTFRCRYIRVDFDGRRAKQNR